MGAVALLGRGRCRLVACFWVVTSSERTAQEKAGKGNGRVLMNFSVWVTAGSERGHNPGKWKIEFSAAELLIALSMVENFWLKPRRLLTPAVVCALCLHCLGASPRVAEGRGNSELCLAYPQGLPQLPKSR